MWFVYNMYWKKPGNKYAMSDLMAMPSVKSAYKAWAMSQPKKKKSKKMKKKAQKKKGKKGKKTKKTKKGQKKKSTKKGPKKGVKLLNLYPELSAPLATPVKQKQWPQRSAGPLLLSWGDQFAQQHQAQQQPPVQRQYVDEEFRVNDPVWRAERLRAQQAQAQSQAQQTEDPVQLTDEEDDELWYQW